MVARGRRTRSPSGSSAANASAPGAPTRTAASARSPRARRPDRPGPPGRRPPHRSARRGGRVSDALTVLLTTAASEAEADMIREWLTEAGIHSLAQVSRRGVRLGAAAPRELYVYESDRERALQVLNAEVPSEQELDRCAGVPAPSRPARPRVSRWRSRCPRARRSARCSAGPPRESPRRRSRHQSRADPADHALRGPVCHAELALELPGGHRSARCPDQVDGIEPELSGILDRSKIVPFIGCDVQPAAVAGVAGPRAGAVEAALAAAARAVRRGVRRASGARARASSRHASLVREVRQEVRERVVADPERGRIRRSSLQA